MYQVTLQISARKTESHGFFANEEVANYVAGTLSGFDDGENGPVSGVVTEVDLNMSTSVEEYQTSLAQAEELSQRQQWAQFYEQLSEEQRNLMNRFAPQSLVNP